MVRAIIEGRKTVTRRVVTSRHPISFVGSRGEENDPACWGYAFEESRQHGYMVLARGLDERFNHGRVSIPCPFGVPGDRLWVRETWCQKACEVHGSLVDGEAHYAADGYEVRHVDDINRSPWRPSIHMPRWASRITLEVTDVRVERLHAITEQDAIAEGVNPGDAYTVFQAGVGIRSDIGNTHQGAFMCLWDEINGARAPWVSNPWVWRVEFRRIS
jgi:hypothetical protein